MDAGHRKGLSMQARRASQALSAAECLNTGQCVNGYRRLRELRCRASKLSSSCSFTRQR